MTDPTLSLAAFAGLEKTLNLAIRMDSQIQSALAIHEGKIIHAACQSPDINVFIRIGEQCSVLHTTNENIEVGIQGELVTWITLATAEDKASALINSDMTITGNSQLLIELGHSLRELEIDWEEQVANVIGDVPAHLLGQGARHTVKAGQDLSKSIRQLVETFVYKDAQLLPEKDASDEFYRRLRNIEMRLERTTAKLARLKK